MSRKKNFIPQQEYSKKGRGDSFAAIYKSMMDSEAWRDITKNQIVLYVYMRIYGVNNRRPKKDYPEREDLQNDITFYFNMGLAEKVGLYKRGNSGSFYSDIKALEEHGFIKTISNGKINQTKSIYSFSDEWRRWNKKAKTM